MAMRTSGTPAVRPRRGMARGPLYEDFKPHSEWKEEEGADILLVYLPGFVREQIRVSTERQNTLRIRGERLIGVNKWSRFQEDFPIPENCNMEGIRAKFEGGILTITMPRKSSPQVGPKAVARTTQEAPRPQEAMSKQKGPQEDIQTKANLNADTAKQRDNRSVQPSSPQTTATEPVPQKALYDSTPPKVADKAQKVPQDDIQAKADLSADKEKQRDTKSVRPSSPQKAASEPTDGRSVLASPSPKKSISEPKAQRGQDQTPLQEISGPDSQKQTEEKSIRSMETKQKETETKMPEKAMGKIVEKEKESGEKRKEPMKTENLIAKAAKKRREESDGTVGGQREKAVNYSNAAKAQRSTDVTAGDSGNKLESYMQAVKGLANGLSEERQLMVNMGVAALVIVALGAYITYSFATSGKDKN